ncbi:replication initiator protein A [Limosilactobacillus fermentum]|uniref:replication initiator protein A n=1 Tax=Lactobacillaceae TaxID=33958 RepID=UPI000C7F131D|nr:MULTISPECIES: replication initiator protein A [Lactobacillaceae]MBC9022650.1 replication initiator protein A [Limosilactobacillus fermentum CECT 5716]MCB4716286.1 plasmid replication initiation protein [Limosilactobacillus fermentum]MCH5397779.1 replication initiator protein A [Limosilactobacillus fermentum]WCL70653.1 replication initiator protein A [Lactiplantibacillus plantarum]
MNQANFKFYEPDNVYGALFFQFPKVLMYGEQYKNLSDTAKLAYMVLKDRLEYSLRNNWIDEDGHVYFIFTNQELMELFNCSEHKVIKVKAELTSTGLLFQKQLGFNPKTKKNEPNRLYLSKLDVKATDVYLRGEYGQNTAQTLATSGTAKNAVPYKSAQTLATSGTAKNAVPYKSVDDTPQTLATSGTAKNAVNLYKDSKEIDTNRYNIDTQKLDFSTTNFSSAEIEKQNKDLVTHADDFLTDKDSGLPVFLEPEAVQLLSFWCRTPQQMRRFIGIILNAKYKVEKDHQDIGVLIPLDDEELKPLMTKALRRYFNALRSNEKHIKNVENYLYGTMQNLFGVWWNKQAAREYAAKHPEEEKSADNDNSGLYY